MTPDQRVSRLRSRVLPLAIVVVLATIPFRITSEWRDEPFRDASIGLSRWQGAPDGTRFRWAAGRSRFFVPGELPAARFPLRLEQGWAGPVTVDVLLDGTLANRVVVTAERWTWVTVVLQPRDASRSRMIELVVPGLDDRAEPGKHPEGGLMVGRYGGL